MEGKYIYLEGYVYIIPAWMFEVLTHYDTTVNKNVGGRLLSQTSNAVKLHKLLQEIKSVYACTRTHWELVPDEVKDALEWGAMMKKNKKAK